MTKKLFVAAFVVDEAEFYGGNGGTVEPHDVVSYLATATQDEGISDLCVWPSAEDMLADHAEHGPITVSYLTGVTDADAGDLASVAVEVADDPLAMADWQYEVANGDTKRGYDDWRRSQAEANASERRAES